MGLPRSALCRWSISLCVCRRDTLGGDFSIRAVCCVTRPGRWRGVARRGGDGWEGVHSRLTVIVTAMAHLGKMVLGVM